MTTIKKIHCDRCNTDNYVDLDIVHYDPVVPETNPLVHHCTFCCNTLSRIGSA